MQKKTYPSQSPVAVYRREKPELYRQILEQYAPVFDKYIAIEMYEAGIPPPTCEICGVRVMVSKKRPKRCTTHANLRVENIFTYQRFVSEHPGNYTLWVGDKTSSDDIEVICDVHGPYQQLMKSRISGHGCQKCHFVRLTGNFRIDQDQYMADFKSHHGDLYDYSRVVFKGAQDRIEIGCPKHGYFWQNANVHRAGHGCLQCRKEKDLKRMPTMLINSMKSGKNKDTKPELACKKFLDDHEISYIAQFAIPNGEGVLYYDFYLPDKNLIIEVDGEYWHSSHKQAARDKYKTTRAVESGFKILRISDSDLNFSIIFSSIEDIKANNKRLMENRKDRLR